LDARARELYLIEQPDAPGPAGLGYLATVRPDGGPRAAPVSPAGPAARLYVYCSLSSPNLGDLRGDGRYALHSWPKPFTDDGFDDEEFYVTGRAVPVDDAALHARISKAGGDQTVAGGAVAARGCRPPGRGGGPWWAGGGGQKPTFGDPPAALEPRPCSRPDPRHG